MKFPAHSLLSSLHGLMIFCLTLTEENTRGFVSVWRMPPYMRMPIRRKQDVKLCLSVDGKSWSKLLDVDLSEVGISASTVHTHDAASEKLTNLVQSNPHGQTIANAVISNFDVLSPQPKRVGETISLISGEMNSKASLSSGAVAGISVVSTLVVVLIVTVIMWKVWSKRNARRNVYTTDNLN